MGNRIHLNKYVQLYNKITNNEKITKIYKTDTMNNSRETFGLMGHLCVEIYVSQNRKCTEKC